MITNRYANKCQSCGKYVEVGDGFAYHGGSRWFTVCRSTACHKRLGLDNVRVSVKVKQEKKLSADGYVTMPFDREALPLLRSLPKARWNPDVKKWSCSVEPGDLPRVLEAAEKLGLEVAEGLKRAKAEGTIDSREAKKRADRTRIDGQGLYGFQRGGVEFLALHKRALLGDDMGLGKTPQALVSLSNNLKVIVVAPAAVKYNWQSEAKLWRPDYESFVCSGKKGFRLPGKGEICIVNYDILPDWLRPTEVVGHTRDGKEIKAANLSSSQRESLRDVVLICDEAHLVKNYKAMRSQKVAQLVKAVDKAWFLTGTPLMNRPFDLYGVLQTGEMNTLGGWYKFLDLFNGYKNKYGGYEFGMPEPEVAERMKNVMLRRLKSEVLPDLPSKTYKDVVVNGVSKSLSKMMGSFLDDWIS